MLELTAFSSLCESIAQHLEANREDVSAIAKLALQEWRRSQAMVLIGQPTAIPTQLNLSNLNVVPNVATVAQDSDELAIAFSTFEESETSAVPEESLDAIEDLDSIEYLSTEDFAEEAQEFLESLENLSAIASVPEESEKKPKPEPALTKSTASTSHPPLPNGLSSSEKIEENTIRVAVSQLVHLSNLFGELSIERNGLDLQLKRFRDLLWLLSQRVKTLEQSNFRLRTAYDKVSTQVASAALAPVGVGDAISSPHQDFDILEMDRYSGLHLVSQEIMETVVQIQEVTSDLQTNLEDTEKGVRDLNRTSKLMQTNITQLRMRPISDLLGRFPRALREMELKYGKQVEFKVKGGGTLIDRTILESLSDPLLHLFRNAFDHGIEDPATRKALGKPEVGTIEISAAYRGNQTVLTLRDDGRGIDLDKVRAKALKMGLNESDLQAASKSELLELIFMPGFSTAEKVTDLSGRGVGMDVVRNNLQQIRGEIELDTELGEGTTFTITVPFTLSVVRVLLVESGDMLMAFPTSTIEEMLRLQSEMIIQALGKEFLDWNGLMVPLIRLNQWFQFPRSSSAVDTEAIPVISEPSILMVAQGDDLIGILVDRYWGEQEVTIRQVEGHLGMPPGFSGCTILGDGRIVPLVDAVALLRWIDSTDFSDRTTGVADRLSNLDLESPTTPAIAAADAAKQNTVLVVDDSINVRRFLAVTLQKAGYRVEQAKDGQDALERLRAGLGVQAVISDIEMPRLDGYGFLAHVKSDPNCQHIPIVMLTSRSGDKHRQLAMNLGASAYFSKPFREPELLKTLQQLTNV